MAIHQCTCSIGTCMYLVGYTTNSTGECQGTSPSGSFIVHGTKVWLLLWWVCRGDIYTVTSWTSVGLFVWWLFTVIWFLQYVTFFSLFYSAITALILVVIGRDSVHGTAWLHLAQNRVFIIHLPCVRNVTTSSASLLATVCCIWCQMTDDRWQMRKNLHSIGSTVKVMMESTKGTTTGWQIGRYRCLWGHHRPIWKQATLSNGNRRSKAVV